MLFCSLSPEVLHVSSLAYDVSGAETQYISLTADIYKKMGQLIRLWSETPPLNNQFEKKCKGRDITQSTPLKKKNKDILSTVALAHSKWPAKEVEINQHLQNPQKKVTSDSMTSCIYLTGSSKNFKGNLHDGLNHYLE